MDFKSSPLEGEFAYLATIGQNTKAEGELQLGDLEYHFGRPKMEGAKCIGARTFHRTSTANANFLPNPFLITRDSNTYTYVVIGWLMSGIKR